MTTETNTLFDSVKDAFAPVTDAFKNFQNVEVPESAREFVKRQASTAKERAAEAYAGSEKVTAAIALPLIPSAKSPRSAVTSSRQSIRTPRRSSPASTSWLPPRR